MKEAAVGTAMFMNHSTNVPEDVFGTIIETTLEKKKAVLTSGAEAEIYHLDYLVEVEDSNERAVKTWQMISNGTKLGASVTVLVLDKSPNPKRNKGIVIEEVSYLETSIVGIPCNRQSWVSSAKKSLELAEKRAAKNEPADETPLDTNNEEIEKAMSTKPEVKNAAIVAPETSEKSEKSKLFSRSLAAHAVYKTVVEQIAAKEENIQIPRVVKGMFNEILAQEPRLWELFDILNEVRWCLMSQKNHLEYLGQTDFTEILAAWDEALTEFHAAAIVSFKYWGDFNEESEMVSNSLEIEKTFESLAEVYEKSSDENVQSQVRETGEKLLELAKSIGIIAARDSEPEEVQIPEPTAEQIEKSTVFAELKLRAEQAETALAETQKALEKSEQNYEIAKAGLEVANEAMQKMLRQPLVAAQKV